MMTKLTYVINDPKCCLLLTSIVKNITYKSSCDELSDIFVKTDYDYRRKFINYDLNILLVKQ